MSQKESTLVELFDTVERASEIIKELDKESLVKTVKEYVAKGDRCMDQSADDPKAYAFWDGFHNCALGILRELEDD